MTQVMRGLEILRVRKILPDTAKQLLLSYAFYPYRNWKGFGKDVPRELVCWNLIHGFSPQALLCLLAVDDAGPVGCARVDASPWESEQLGVRIAVLRHLITIGDPAERREIAEFLLIKVREYLKNDIDCITHRIDNQDYETIAGLEAQGFRLVDSQVSFIRGPLLRPYLRRKFTRSCVVRPYVQKDWDAVKQIARQTRFGGRYYNDLRFSKERVDVLYEEWVRLACRKVFADEMMIALRGPQVAGYLSYQFQQWMYDAARIRLMGRGLLAVGRGFKGSALELLREAVLRDPRADFLQCDIHLNNLDFATLLGRGLRMDVAHVQHVFHGWLDEALDRYPGLE